MLNLSEVESALQTAVKARDSITVETLRALKTRIQNEQISKGSELSEADVLLLVQSEAKRRKEAATAFRDAGRTEAADKEEAELKVLAVFLPEQASEEDIAKVVEAKIAENSWTTADFGKAMGALKGHFGNTADGALVSKILKEKLN
ncbi:MAG TPA: GatB/YqeY domain-containing protein [Patescibacteria group bacterium]|jgi:hypothetical protein|nr:GatB/YqeY domain-containing protein [Patescibacteria group bacterium]